MTTPIREWLEQEIGEGGSALLTLTLKDEAGNPVPLIGLNTLTWTHYNERDQSIINGRNAVNIKNANGGTVGATDGKVTLQLLAADNPITDSTKRSEWKVALIRGTYNGGTSVVEKRIAYRVVNLEFVP